MVGRSGNEGINDQAILVVGNVIPIGIAIQAKKRKTDNNTQALVT